MDHDGYFIHTKNLAVRV